MSITFDPQIGTAYEPLSIPAPPFAEMPLAKILVAGSTGVLALGGCAIVWGELFRLVVSTFA